MALYINRIWFLGILYLCSINLIGAAESKTAEEDFEAFVTRGYYDFLNRVGKEKFIELELEGPIEEKIKEEKPPVKTKLTIPLVAQGHETIYQRFLNGVLVYRPNKGSDDGMVTLSIRDLANPLEGTFDLSRCGDTGNYLSISTGYKKEKKPENANKVEIWFAPRFLIDRELGTTATHFKPIMGNWKEEQAPVAMFFTGGGWDLGYYDYLATENMDNLFKINLYENWAKGSHTKWIGHGQHRWSYPTYVTPWWVRDVNRITSFVFELK